MPDGKWTENYCSSTSLVYGLAGVLGHTCTCLSERRRIWFSVTTLSGLSRARDLAPVPRPDHAGCTDECLRDWLFVQGLVSDLGDPRLSGHSESQQVSENDHGFLVQGPLWWSV